MYRFVSFTASLFTCEYVTKSVVFQQDSTGMAVHHVLAVKICCGLSFLYFAALEEMDLACGMA